MPSHTSRRPLASGLVALVTTGALLFGAAPAFAQAPARSVSAALRAESSAAAGILKNGDQLLPGEFTSSGGAGGYTFRMQDDGNAVTYDAMGHAVFSTGTSGRGNRLVLQDDGNVVVYSDQNRPLWSTGTDNEPDAVLIIQDDGNLVLYREDDTPAWASSVNRSIPEPPFNTLATREPLLRGHQLTSENGLFRAVMQRDGNLVGYGPDGVLWNTGTRGAGNVLIMKGFGDLEILDEHGYFKWAADTEGEDNSVTLEDNGVLTVLDEDDQVLWTSQSGLPGSTMYAPNTLETDGLLRSDDGRYRAVVQADGNVVVYGPTGPVWQTRTAGVDSSLEFSKDGTVRVVTGSGAVAWTAKPAAGAVGPYRLVMQTDGNLVEYDGHHRAVWSNR